jgi:glutathione S-transferase
MYPSITLYGNTQATCTQRVMILFEELNLSFDVVPINLKVGEQKSESFLTMNPFGKVPCVRYQESSDSEEKIIFESRTILRYFANKFDSDTDMYPDVNADIWLESSSRNLTPILEKVVYERVFKKMRNEKCDYDVVDQALSELPKILEIFNDRLRNNKYLAGDSFTIADLDALPYLYLFVKCDSEYKQFIKEYRHVYHYYKKLLLKESVRKVLFIKE